MTNTDTTTDPAADESAKYDNANDQQMLHRLDGPFATIEMIEQAIERGAEMTPTLAKKRYSPNEPYTPLVAVPSPERPERIVSVEAAAQELKESANDQSKPAA
jgi:hypothetical protein